MIEKIVKLSALVQFSAAKASLIASTTTLATVLSLRFDIPWLYSMAAVIASGVLVVIFVWLSGWARKEYTYTAELSDLTQRLKRIEGKLGDMDGKN